MADNKKSERPVPTFLQHMKMEPRGQLLELRESMYWEPLQQALALLVDDQLQRLLKVNLIAGSEELVLEKARLEGAQKLVKTLNMI